MRRPLVQAHRGLSDEHPENTLAAFQAAAAAGFDAIELDVRLTHDGEVVVLHDANIARTTDGVGRVAEMDYDELLSYDTGAGPVPRLDEVVAAIEATGWRGTWNVEAKTADVATPAVELLQHHGLADRAVLTAMDPDALALIKSRVQTGLITLGPPDAEDRREALAAGAAWFNVDHDFLSERVLTQAHDDGLRVGAWTVNDADAAIGLARLGVDAIITDTRAVLEAIGRVRQTTHEA